LNFTTTSDGKPDLQPVDPKDVKTPTDYENAFALTPVLAGKVKGLRLNPLPNYTNAPFTAKTPSGDEIEFRFTKAHIGTFLMRQDLPANPNDGVPANAVVRGMYINLKVTLKSNQPNKYDEIRFVQLVRDVQYVDRKAEPLPPFNSDDHPVRRFRSGYDAKGNPEAKGPSLGWRVDVPEIENDNPFFQWGKWGKNESELWDSPGRGEQTRSDGPQFITCAFGLKKGQKPEYLGSIRWGVYITGNLEVWAVTGPNQPNPVIDTQFPPEFNDTYKRFK
jgi:hypothetical protein